MPARVLIADNGENVRGLLASWLEDVGYRCVPTDAGQALVAARGRATRKATEQTERRLPDEIAQGRQRLLDTIRRVETESVPAVLMAVLEARSPETHEHCTRVSHGAVALARTCHLPSDQVHAIRRAALLHDIGKIAIPDRLLDEAGPLTEADLRVLRTHVEIGQEVLASVPALEPLAAIVGATHERYDGAGYPAGLSADAIPLAARIISVADAYDAMTSARRYNDPVSTDEANVELVRQGGAQFDPDIVRAWLQLAELRQYCQVSALARSAATS
jgi:putative nucleotidyltransferase with HDIG domain